MPREPEERLDRHDFMIGSIATIGASTALVANAGSANARDLAASSESPGPRAPSATAFILFHKPTPDGGETYPE
jgi:hypothetical protein